MQQKPMCQPRIQRFDLGSTDTAELFRLSAALAEVTQQQEQQLEARLTAKEKIVRDQDKTAASRRVWERLRPELEKLKR